MRPQFSWQALIDLATQQELLPPLIQALEQRALLPPQPHAARGRDHVAVRLQQYYVQHLARRESQKRQLQNILRPLNRLGIAPLILKGARYMVAPIDDWCEARTFRDIDLLLRADNADRAFSELVNLGYQPGEPYMPNYHHLPDLQRGGEPGTVEIHTAALASAGEKVMSTEFVWRNASPVADGTFYVLPAHWHALHSLLHHQLSDRGYNRCMLDLKSLWEWTMLSRDWSRDQWQQIVTHIRNAEALDVLGSFLLQAHRLFDAALPDLVPISATAAQNAATTLDFALAPRWRRRGSFVVDQFCYAFARETLAARYGKAPANISVADGARYLVHLLRSHRGGLLRRLVGYRDRPS